MVEHTVCIRCGRKLKSPKSRQLGFGDICWAKHNSEGVKTLFNKEELYAKEQFGYDTQASSRIEQ